MRQGWLGIPFGAWGLICLAVAVLWAVVWPAERAADAQGLRLFLIRWGHSIVWLLLGVMCLLRASGRPALLAWAGPAGMAALAVYLAFLAASFVLR